MKKFALIIFFFTGVPVSLYAAGTTAGEFLELGGGARIAAMGEAGVSLVDQSNTLHWNPGLLGLLEARSLSFMYGAYVEAIDYQYLAFTHPTDSLGTFAGSVQTLGTGDIRQTDNDGRDLGGFSPRDSAATLGWGRKIGKGWSGGMSGKFIKSKIVTSASTFAMDGGVGYQTGSVSLGGAVRNLGGELKYDAVSSPLPMSYHAGASFQIGRPWLVAAEAEFPKNEDTVFGLGAEWARKFSNTALALRGGYNTRTEDLPGTSGPSLGLGWIVRNVGLDYAWVPLGDLDQTHRISITLLMGTSEMVRPPQTVSTRQVYELPPGTRMVGPYIQHDLARNAKPQPPFVFMVRD